jgi:hypothetical protein
MERVVSLLELTFDGLSTTINLKYQHQIQIRICMLTEFLISGDNIFISALHKCEGVSGSIMLDKIELFARKFGIKTISLNDASNIIIEECNVKISLQVLYLLTAGMSWYNSKGYVDETMYEGGIGPDIRTDDINQPMDIFMQKVVAGLIETENFTYFQANGKTFDDTVDSQGIPTNYMHSLLSKINSIVPDLHIGHLVKDYFTIVKTLLKTPPTPTNCILFKLFEELISFIDGSFLLRKDLNGSTKTLAGKRRKSCKKCVKKKKKKNCNRHTNKRKGKKGNQILTFNLNEIK